MYCNRFCFVTVAAVALAALLGAMGEVALAEEPELQPQLFAYLFSPGDEAPPDFQDPASVALVAHGCQGRQQWWFEMWEGDPADPLPLAGTIWTFNAVDFVHVAKGGAEKLVDFAWEGAMPPPYGVTRTGLEGDVVFIGAYPVRRVTSGEDPQNAGPTLWRVDWNATEILYVWEGRFSK